MTKPIYTWIKYVVVCAILMGATLSANARRCIYLVGAYNNWTEPIETNAPLLEDSKLYETSEGSNIYSAIITPTEFNSSLYFTFFTELTSAEDARNGVDSWSAHRLLPAPGYNAQRFLWDNTQEDAPVAYNFDLSRKPYITNTNTELAWVIYIPKGNEVAPVKFVVDLNKNSVSVMFDMPVLVVYDNSKPTIETISDYPAMGKKVYIPAGECRFRAYNLLRDKYYSSATPTQVSGSSVSLNVESDAWCTVSGWGGGTLSLSGITVTINNKAQSPEEAFTGIILDQKDMFVDLTKVAPSKVGVNNFVHYKGTANGGKYQFTIDGGLDKPFRFLEFNEDKLVNVFQPVTDLTLKWVGDKAHGNIATGTNPTPAYWSSKNDGTTTVTIDPTANNVNAITFTMPSLAGTAVTAPDGIMIIDSATEYVQTSAREISDGVYTTSIYNNPYVPGLVHRLKIFRSKHTFAQEEPDFLNSYTLSFADTEIAPGPDGVAETSFIFNDGVNAGAGNELRVKTEGQYGMGISYYVIIDFNTGKIYFDHCKSYYLTGTATGGKIPTYANRKEFDEYRHTDIGSGYFIELPEGDVTLRRTNLFSNLAYHSEEKVEATFNSDGVAKTDYYNRNSYPDEALLHNCPGGKIFFSEGHSAETQGCNFHMIAVDKIKYFDLVIQQWNNSTYRYDNTSLGKLTLTDAATQTYTGRVTIPANSLGVATCQFLVNSDSDLGFGGCGRYLSIDPDTKSVVYDLDPAALDSFFALNNVDNPTVDITLSLEKMNVTVILLEGDLRTAYTLNFNTGTQNVSLTTGDGKITGSAYVTPDADGNISVNLSTSDGRLIVPVDGDTEMEFDADGVFAGDLEIIKSPSPEMLLSPLSAGKWQMKSEDYQSDYLGYSFDLENKTVTFVSDNHATRLYAVAADANATITDPREVKRGALLPNNDGTYSAKIYIGEGQKLHIVGRNNGSYISNGAGNGLSPQAIYSTGIDFNKAQVDIPVRDYIKNWTNFSGWNIDNNPGCDAMITYDPEKMMLHVDMELSGVEDIIVDDINFDAEPVYYDLQGNRITKPHSGQIYIEVRGNNARKIVK